MHPEFDGFHVDLCIGDSVPARLIVNGEPIEGNSVPYAAAGETVAGLALSTSIVTRKAQPVNRDSVSDPIVSTTGVARLTTWFYLLAVRK